VRGNSKESYTRERKRERERERKREREREGESSLLYVIFSFAMVVFQIRRAILLDFEEQIATTLIKIRENRQSLFVPIADSARDSLVVFSICFPGNYSW
jgi:hypothetical protein